MTDSCDLCVRPVRTTHISLPPGAFEVCRYCAELADGAAPVWVRPLSRDDLELVLAWRSNPAVYRHFRGQDGPLRWEDHLDWYDTRSSERFDFVLRFGGRRVGVGSVDADDYVSVFLGDLSARGEGVATRGLAWLTGRFGDDRRLRAEIHESNRPSIALFERCGYERTERDEEWLEYGFDPSLD